MSNSRKERFIAPSEQGVDIVNNTEKMNEFDYNKMMKDFDTKERHEKELNKIKKKWNGVGKVYKERIKRMNELREENYRRKNREGENKLKKKDQILLTALESANQKRVEDKNKNIMNGLMKENEAKKKVEEHLIEGEEERQEAAAQTQKKIQMFNDNNRKAKEQAHMKVVEKLQSTQEKHEKNLVELHQRLEKYEQESREKAIKKYSAFYWNRKEGEKKEKNKKGTQKKKLAQKRERLEELIRERDADRLKIQKRIKEMIKKKEEHDLSMQKEYEEKKIENMERFENCNKRKEEGILEQIKRREMILDNESVMISRPLYIDNDALKKKLNSNQKTISGQMTLEGNGMDFKKKMNLLKENSIMKLTPEERLMKYQKKKREEEEERKKKEEEEKLAKKK